MVSLPVGRERFVDENGGKARILALLARLREAEATVDEVTMPDGTSRLLITVPLGQVVESIPDDRAA